ncbi:hypothetical protein GRF59_07260 [Paenibacillus sp. HJL G12]|uniref:Uncharacterized protein n=1 Tax=Paenibacillus dendrobii TaxID=2691084 RepID=A0A7X3LHN9_9BACL|nr:hypothetical protein [Paenibacillus dendrobii]MWV43429.1 hypothetical protein [Paenibacillus dendrobii]
MGFLHLFWGFLFLIDIRINGFDVLPDVIGYVLFFLGFVKLENRFRSQHFHKAKNMSVGMIVLSMMSLVLSWTSPQAWAFYFLFITMLTILKLYIVFHLCYGISDLAGRRGLHEFQNKAIQRWRWFIAVAAAVFIMMLIAPLAPMLVMIMSIVLLIASLVIYVLMMLLTREAEHVLHR